MQVGQPMGKACVHKHVIGSWVGFEGKFLVFFIINFCCIFFPFCIYFVLYGCTCIISVMFCKMLKEKRGKYSWKKKLKCSYNLLIELLTPYKEI